MQGYLAEGIAKCKMVWLRGKRFFLNEKDSKSLEDFTPSPDIMPKEKLTKILEEIQRCFDMTLET